MSAMTKRNLTLAAALLIGATATAGCRGAIKSKPPIHPQQNMDNVHYIEAQEPESFWEDGRGMRPPVPGTIAIGELRVDEAYHEGVEDGEYLASLPDSLELNEAFLERGQERYDIYCTPCHGAAGRGNGIVGKRAATFGSLIPTFHDATRRSYPVGRVFHVITNGYNNMSSYASQIPVDDRWAIASYVRVLQINQGASETQYAAGAEEAAAGGAADDADSQGDQE